MNYTEIAKIIELESIPVSEDRNEDLRFRIEILKGDSENERFFPLVRRREAFRLNLHNHSAEENRQDKWILIENECFSWEHIQGESIEEVFAKVIQEIWQVFSDPTREAQDNMKYFEVVKVIDLEPIVIEETNQYLKFRVEIVKETKARNRYETRIYRMECFTIQPSFPILDNGKPKYEWSSPVLIVEDRTHFPINPCGRTVAEVIQKVLQAIERLREQSN
jgi:hypothetical protein